MTDIVGVEFDLPDGWLRVGLDEPDHARLLRALASLVIARSSVLAPIAVQVRTAIARAAEEFLDAGACHLLARPADDELDGDDPIAITGAVYACAPLDLGADELLRALDERGEVASLGDLDGVPIVAVVRRGASEVSLPSLRVTYLIMCEQATAVLTFSALETVAPHVLIMMIARVVSAVRMVRDCDSTFDDGVRRAGVVGMSAR